MAPQFGNSSLLRLLDATSDWSSYEEIVAAFETAWRQGGSPQIENYLRGNGPSRHALLIELVHTDLEFRLKAGQPTSAADYLQAWPEIAADAEAAQDLADTEADLRRRLQRKLPLSTTAGSTRMPREVGLSAWPQVSGYEIVAAAGEGGMGVVYKAIDHSLGRPVALKFLPDDYLRDSDRLARFRYEARAASALNHPHICTVHALGEHEGRPFIVLEYVEGTTLQSLLVRRPTLDQAIRWITQAARALAAAHAAGVVHRDVKPDNLMIRDDGYLKVVDFGLSRRLPGALLPGSGSSCETDPGTILGTVLYMSPEQARGLPAEAASDVFALGVVFYQLLTGEHPFAAESPLLTLAEIAGRQPPLPSRLNPAVPAALDRLVEGMLHKDSRLRPSAAEIDGTLTSLRSRSTAMKERAASRPIVRREAELATLQSALALASAGQGSVVCLVGEPGIGKTTLIDEFLMDAAATSDPPLIARGQCSERIGESEVYQPVLEALDGLLRSEHGSRLSRLMRLVAPTWLSQVGPYHSDTSGVPDGVRARSQSAWLREFDSLVEEATRAQPLVLVLDDVQWADLSTIDLLSHLGRQCVNHRLLLVLAYRPTEMMLSRHPLRQVLQELQGRGACRELPLECLRPDDVERYLALALGEHDLPPNFAGEIYARTEGSPLFMVDLLGYLVERGVVAQVAGRWNLVQELPDLRQDLPASVRSMIGRKLDRLDANQRRVLATASVQGHAFDSATVTGALAGNLLEIEDHLQQLDRVHRLVRFVSEQELPDGSLTARYVFVHSLYQQALYNDLSPGRRTSLSASMAQCLEDRYRQRRSLVAAQLAYLYEVARNQLQAARCLCLLAQNAGKVFAHQDAIALARRGLRLLEPLPDSAERQATELELQTLLGLQLQVTQGYGAAAAKHAYTRALALCPTEVETNRRFPVLWGLWLCYKVASNLMRAQSLADELSSLARQQGNPALALQAHQALGMTAFCRGQLTTSLRNVEQAITIYDPLTHGELASSFGQDPSVMCRAYGSVVLWLLGFPDSARQQSQTTLEMCFGMSPTTQAVAWHFAAMLSQLLREPWQARRHAERASAIASEHGLSFWQAGSEVLIGWATAMQGARAEGIARLQAGLAKWRATGSATYETYYLGLLAELLLADGQLEQAGRALDEALLLVQRTDERFYLPELHRLRAELEFRIDASDLARRQGHLCQALSAAEHHEAKSLALRAAASQMKWNASPEATNGLANLCQWFTEGLDTADVRDAQLLLDSCQ